MATISRNRRNRGIGITGRDLAEKLGMTPSMVSQLKKMGKLKLHRDGSIHRDNIKLLAQDTERKPAIIPMSTDDPEPEMDEETMEGPTNFFYWRAVREKANAEKAKIETETLLGIRIDREMAEMVAAEAAMATRDALLAIPEQLGPLLAPQMTARQARDMLRKAILEALENFKVEFSGAGTPHTLV